MTSVFGSSFSYSLSGRVATIFLPQLLDSIIGHKLNCIPPVRSSHAVISLLVRHALAELEIAKLAVSRGVDLRRGQSQTQTRHFHAFNGRHQRPQPHRDCPPSKREKVKRKGGTTGESKMETSERQAARLRPQQATRQHLTEPGLLIEKKTSANGRGWFAGRPRTSALTHECTETLGAGS